MAIPVTTRAGRRFLGNRNEREAHDLQHEKVQCQIEKILQAGNGVGFYPDTPAQARSEGYDNCAWCIGGSTR